MKNKKNRLSKYCVIVSGVTYINCTTRKEGEAETRKIREIIMVDNNQKLMAVSKPQIQETQNIKPDKHPKFHI